MARRFSQAHIKKVALREEVMNNRRDLGPAQMRQYSASIVNDAISLIEKHRPRNTVALYYPINGELDMRGIGEYMLSEGAQVALPRVKTKEAPLVFNQWNMCEPQDKDLQLIPCSTGEEVVPDIVIVPLVRFDKNGHRIGYGSGYYDRTFEKLENAYKIGVGLSFQEVDPIEAEAHDIKMDAIITEEGIVYQKQDW